MGCFGYICKGCNTSIRGNCFKGGEKAILIHVRHGEELGRVEGHYNEYGGVFEQEGLNTEEEFRGLHDGINGHDEICNSEFDFNDSEYNLSKKRIYNGAECKFRDYLKLIAKEELLKYEDVRESELFLDMNSCYKDEINDCLNKGQLKPSIEFLFLFGASDIECFENYEKWYKKFSELPPVKRSKYSGVVAWHSKCYNSATEDEQKDLKPSKSDPNQSWGKVRRKYT